MKQSPCTFFKSMIPLLIPLPPGKGKSLAFFSEGCFGMGIALPYPTPALVGYIAPITLILSLLKDRGIQTQIAKKNAKR
ncbi:MAG: hypothetical protein COA85_09215 [Robiginitomaculum sp.]|nr:MAG: hypothetical protein COA85_09215 [Robiginitomaculum sp.]